MPTTPALSSFASGLRTETAFDVLAVAKRLKAAGKDVVELQIGDSPFPTTKAALDTGVRALHEGATHYCPSPGLPSFREAIARNHKREFGVEIGPENVVIAPGAKVFEQFFSEAFLDPGDAVLIFSPHFPTYEPNIQRRGGTAVYSALRQENHFRPDLNDVKDFLKRDRARAIFLNSPHNPTGGVATADDMRGLAELVRGTNVAVFSDEPYCQSYSMSGWRLGYAVGSKQVVEAIGKMINTSLSCVPPFIQQAGEAALGSDADERDRTMALFQKKVELLVSALKKVDGVKVLMPAGTFYVFPDVSAICRRLKITSHGLALFLLEHADEKFGVACLGGECFGPAGQGFLRFSCAEPDDRLALAVDFLADAVTREDRVRSYLEKHPKYRAG
jgi:aspartate aminotransferase